MSRRSFLQSSARGAAFAAACSAGPWLTGCSSEAPARAGVKLGWIPNVEYSGIFVGVEDGYYSKQGLQVDVIPGGPNSAVVPLVTTNRALVGIEAVTENVATAVSSGAKLRVVGAGLQKSPECWVSLAEDPIKTPRDIEGRRLGITLAGKNTALVFMKKNGVDVSKVKLVPIQFDPAPLAAREIDALWGFASNQPVALAMRGIKTHVMPLADHQFNRMQNVFFVTQETLDDEVMRRNATKFLTATRQGWEAALKDHRHAAEVTIRKYGKDLGLKLQEQLKELAAIAPYITTAETDANGLFWMSDSLIEETIASLTSIGIKLDESLFTNDLLK